LVVVVWVVVSLSLVDGVLADYRVVGAAYAAFAGGAAGAGMSGFRVPWWVPGVV